MIKFARIGKRKIGILCEFPSKCELGYFQRRTVWAVIIPRKSDKTNQVFFNYLNQLEYYKTLLTSCKLKLCCAKTTTRFASNYLYY